MSRSQPDPVFVGVDGSAESTRAAALAADEAVARGTCLVLVHVTDTPNHHRTVLTDAAAVVSRRYPSLELTTRRADGDPAVALTAESREGCLLVVGHRGHCGHRAGAGSVAERVAGLATGPVLVHRSGDDVPSSAPVLVGLAPGRVDDAVLEFAFAAASRRQAPLYALTVWSDFDIVGTEHGPADSRPVLHQASSLSEAIRHWSDKYPEVNVKVTARHGLDASIALAAASHTAQLAVIGARSVATPTQTGSLAHALIHRAACPVVVVPGSDR